MNKTANMFIPAVQKPIIGLNIPTEAKMQWKIHFPWCDSYLATEWSPVICIVSQQQNQIPQNHA